jgi:calcineurin-like phosphoesterase family protein
MDERVVEDYLKQLHGTHILIAGNHDRCHPHHKRHVAATRRYLEYGFAAVLSELRWENWLICHFPCKNDEVRYEQYRPDPSSYDGLICGHIHNKWLTKGKMLNVGVDVWQFTPVPAIQVMGMLCNTITDSPEQAVNKLGEAITVARTVRNT